jgi:hypothetical protein
MDSEIQAVITAFDSASARSVSPSRVQFAFCLSLLHDIPSVGGRVRVVDSEIFVSWPDWSAAGARPVVRRALTLLAEPRSVTEAERRQFQNVFAPSLPPEDVVRFLTSGRFRLASVDERHPSGIRYSDIFSFALRLWTMPYRGRQGRQFRFVVIGDAPEVCPGPVIIGLIEIGDDAPQDGPFRRKGHSAASRSMVKAGDKA